MSKIRISDSYYFTADENEYILYECGRREKIDRKTRKGTGEIIDYETVIGYYTTLESLVRGCRQDAVRKKIRDNQLTSINEIIDYLNEINKKLSEMLSKLD
nr:MAG TPA: protein of unknown function (DUF5405) [Caudoviricetes sp.]